MKRSTRRAIATTSLFTALAFTTLGVQHRYVAARRARAKARLDADSAQFRAALDAYRAEVAEWERDRQAWHRESEAWSLNEDFTTTPPQPLRPAPAWPFPPPPGF